MRLINLALVVLLVTFSGWAEAAVISKKNLSFKVAGQTYRLDLYEGAGAALDRRPGILLVPEYWGKDELTFQPAEILAAKGYVVLVLDPYGEGRRARDSVAADRLVEEAEAKGIDRVIDLVSRAVDLLKSQKGVDPNRLGAIGFGYGGGLVYNLAKSGSSDLKAVVSFYGGTKKIRETSRLGHLPEFLYFRPTNDVYTTDQEFSRFKTELTNSGFSYEIFTADAGYYGFIHKGIEGYTDTEGKTFMYYDAKLALEAWEKAYRFLLENLQDKSSSKSMF